jgi:hypothetical protein
MKGRPVLVSIMKKIEGGQNSIATTIFRALNRIVTAKDLTTKSNNFTIPHATKPNFVSTSTKMQWHASTTIFALLHTPRMRY